jgi:hypothetical protein
MATACVHASGRRRHADVLPQLVSHSGGAPGVSTFLALFPDDAFGVALLCNSNNQYDTNTEVLAAIAGAVLGASCLNTPA